MCQTLQNTRRHGVLPVPPPQYQLPWVGNSFLLTLLHVYIYAFAETCIPSVCNQQLLEAWHFPKALGCRSGVNKTPPEGTRSCQPPAHNQVLWHTLGVFVYSPGALGSTLLLAQDAQQKHPEAHSWSPSW